VKGALTVVAFAFVLGGCFYDYTKLQGKDGGIAGISGGSGGGGVGGSGLRAASARPLDDRLTALGLASDGPAFLHSEDRFPFDEQGPLQQCKIKRRSTLGAKRPEALRKV
jgi:hypothetical protein